MKQATDLRNKRVVVLGGSSGIGFAVAEHASTQGASIVIASSNPARVQKAPVNASLLWALAFTGLMYLISYIMYRRGWFVRI